MPADDGHGRRAPEGPAFEGRVAASGIRKRGPVDDRLRLEVEEGQVGVGAGGDPALAREAQEPGRVEARTSRRTGPGR